MMTTKDLKNSDKILIRAFDMDTVIRRYEMKRDVRRMVYYAHAKFGACMRHHSHIRVYDMEHKEIFHIYRPLAFNGSCCCTMNCLPRCRKRVLVSKPAGELIGTVERTSSLCKLYFRIKNSDNQDIYRIVTPLHLCRTPDVLQVENLAGQYIAIITNKFPEEFANSYFGTTEIFGVIFQQQLDISLKYILLGAAFLINHLYFDI